MNIVIFLFYALFIRILMIPIILLSQQGEQMLRNVEFVLTCYH